MAAVADAVRPGAGGAAVSREMSDLAACVEINFQAPSRRRLRSCVCSMARSFQAIDATLSPLTRRLDGVEVHELIKLTG